MFFYYWQITKKVLKRQIKLLNNRANLFMEKGNSKLPFITFLIGAAYAL